MKDVSNPLEDDRFSAMFSDPNFQIDEDSEVTTSSLAIAMYYRPTPLHLCYDITQEFQAVHPVIAKANMKKKVVEQTTEQDQDQPDVRITSCDLI